MAEQKKNDVCLIDSNELVRTCMEKQKKKAGKNRSRRYADASTQGFEGEADDEAPGAEALFDGDAFSDAESAKPPEPAVDYVAQAKEEAQQILAEAKEEAQRILKEAASRSEALKMEAETDGRREGYDLGYQEAMEARAQWEQETKQLKEALTAEHDKKLQNMEQELVDVVCSVVEKVFLVQFGDKEELIFHAVDQVLSNVEGSREFLIHVNEKNAEYLRNKKEEIRQKIGQEVVLDIALDPLLDDTQCMIETDGGLFDCSLDVQMRNLVKNIRSLC